MTNNVMANDRLPATAGALWDYIFDTTDGCTRPAVLSLDAVGGSLFTVREVLRMGESILRSGDVSVNADGTLVNRPVLPEVAPGTTDEFERYVRELAELNDAEAVTYTRDYCLGHSDEVAMKVRTFINGYVARTGVPIPGINVVYIAGRYRETWIGLHNDACRTFLVPVHGRKNMMLWPPDYFTDLDLERKSALNGVRFGHVDVSPYVDDALVLDTGPGEVLFIPEQWWHYNRLTDLETTLGLSIGVFHTGTPATAFTGAFDAVAQMAEFTEPSEYLDPTPAGVVPGLASVRLPKQAERMVDAFRDTLRLQVLTRSTALGVIGGGKPFREAVPLTPRTHVRGRASCPVILLDLSDGEGLLFALGTMSRTPSAPALVEFVRLLATGQEFSLASVTAPGKEEDLYSWVAKLHARGAIDVVR